MNAVSKVQAIKVKTDDQNYTIITGLWKVKTLQLKKKKQPTEKIWIREKNENQKSGTMLCV